MSDQDVLDVIAEELASALQPLTAAFQSTDAMRDFLEELGWDFATVPAALDSLRAPVEQVYGLVNGTDEIGAGDIGALLDRGAGCL